MRKWPASLWFTIFLAAVTAVRLAVSALAPLGGDEAYYWLWSRHPDLGYYDHPPMISFLIGLFGLAGGSTAFVRMASVLLAAVAAAFTFKLARAVTGSDRAAWVAGGLTAVCPIFAAKALEASPDTPLMAFSVIYAYAVYSALFEGNQRSWLRAGLALGLALTTKLTALLLPASTLIYLAASPRHRAHLRRPWPYLSLLVSAAVFSPFLLWCSANDWITFRFHFITRVSQDAYAWKNWFLTFLGEQAAAYSPFLFILCAAAVALAFTVKSDERSKYRFLAVFGLVPLAAFGLVSLRCRVFPHWTMGGYPFLFILCGAMYARWLETGRRRQVEFFRLAAGFAGLMTVLFYLAVCSPGLQSLFVKPGDLNEIFAYSGLSDRIKQEGRDAFVLTDSYARSSSLSYYTGSQVYLISKMQIMGKEFLRWQDWGGLLGRDAVYIDSTPMRERPDIRETLASSFRTLEPEEVWEFRRPRSALHRDGFLIKKFYVTICRGFYRNEFYGESDFHLLQALHSGKDSSLLQSAIASTR